MNRFKKRIVWIVIIVLVVIAVSVGVYYKMFRRDPQWVEQQKTQEKKLDDLDKLLEKQGSPKPK